MKTQPAFRSPAPLCRPGFAFHAEPPQWGDDSLEPLPGPPRPCAFITPGGEKSGLAGLPDPVGRFSIIVLLVFGLLNLLLVPSSYGQIPLPDIGDSSGTVLSARDEQRLGEAFMREIRAHLNVIDDPDIVEYVQSLGYRLASQSEADGLRFTFFVVEDSTINAFAAPGGFIGVNTGLILAAESESELAAVIAHEIAHVTQHHIARAFELANTTNLPAMAGLIAAIILGASTGSGEVGQAAAAALTAGRAQLQLDFTRANEQEADRVGMQVLSKAGFDPRAMPAFFERLQQSYRYYAEPPEFLSTHPVTVSRIADTRNRAEQYPYRQYMDSTAYQLVGARLQVMARKQDPKQAVRYFEDILKTGKFRNRKAARYGYVLALMSAGELRQAREELQPLLEQDPDRVAFRAALARIELDTGNTDKALSVYADALRLYPDDKMLTRGYADALMRARQPTRVLRLLDDYSRRQPLDAALYKLSAEAYQQIGNSVDANLALAEHYYLDGQLDAAIHQLQVAMNEPGGDFYRTSRIEARLKYFEEEQALRAEK